MGSGRAERLGAGDLAIGGDRQLLDPGFGIGEPGLALGAQGFATRIKRNRIVER